jgi:hypothetical protein
MSGGGVFDDSLAQHIAVAEACRRDLRAPFEAMLRAWANAIRGGGNVLGK